MAEMTAPAPDNIGGVKSLKFSSLKPGDTVTVVTENSTYWFTLTAGKTYRRASRWITGVSVVTNSRNFGQFTRSPHETDVLNFIKTGKPVLFQDGGGTSNIKEILVNGKAL